MALWSTYLCKIQLQLLAVEVCFVEFYSRSCCRFRFAEIYSDSSKASKQLKCNLVIVDGEKCFESLLQVGEQQGGEMEGKRKAFTKKKFIIIKHKHGIEPIIICLFFPPKSILFLQVSCYSYSKFCNLHLFEKSLTLEIQITKWM